jgi:pimeloyl-ACP methyl ester carboxylesterase
MVFHTFGSKENSVAVLIHGMLTPWQIWGNAVEHLPKDYYLIVPELDAHTEDEPSDFSSVEEEAWKIKEYILENTDGNISLLCGLSMGGRIAAILAGLPGITVDNLVLDGAPLLSMPNFMIGIMKKNYKMIIDKSKKRDPGILESCKRDFLPEKHIPDYLKIADNMEEKSINNILDSVFSAFEIKKYENVRRILFLHGTKGNESVSKKAAKKMKEINPQTEIKCFKGYKHAELLCFKEEEWIATVQDWLTSKQV